MNWLGLRRGRRPAPAPRHAISAPRNPAAPAAAPPAYGPPAPPEPSFTARPPRPAALTAPMPVYPARPFTPGDSSPLDRGTPVWPGVRPVIGDYLAARHQPPAPEVPRVPLDSRAMFYSGPGWAGRLMHLRRDRGDWELLQPIVERGYERNAAACAVALVRNRTRIAEAVERQCAAIGHPELAAPLLRRKQELLDAAASELAAAAGQLAATGGAR